MVIVKSHYDYSSHTYCRDYDCSYCSLCLVAVGVLVLLFCVTIIIIIIVVIIIDDITMVILNSLVLLFPLPLLILLLLFSLLLIQEQHHYSYHELACQTERTATSTESCILAWGPSTQLWYPRGGTKMGTPEKGTRENGRNKIGRDLPESTHFHDIPTIFLGFRT